MTQRPMTQRPSPTRRRLLLAAATAPFAAAAGGCARPGPDYAAAVADTWRDTPPGSVGNRDQLEREIVRFALLSPSHRNRQPWRFELGPGWITLLPDPGRRLPVADPDDRLLHVSVGAALQTMIASAAAAGLAAELEPVADGVRVNYRPDVPGTQVLYDAVLKRQTARVPFSTEAPPAALLDRLVRNAAIDGVEALVVTEPAGRERVLELTVAAAEKQLRDPAWLAEYLGWYRFDAAEALARRDGVYGAAQGYPGVPGWLGRRLFDLVTTPARERIRWTEQLQGTGALLVLATPGEDPAAWRALGRAYQQVALVATANGLRSAPANPAIEYPDTAATLAADLGLRTAKSLFVLRVGTGGPELPRSLRRPAADVTTGQG